MMNRKLIFIGMRWCPPCRHARNCLIQEVEKDCPGQVQVVDAEDDPDNYAKKHKVTKVPTILLFDGGEMVKMYSGVLPQAGQLVNWLKGGELHGTDRCDG